MTFTLSDIYKQYNKLHEHWYTKISSLQCAEDRNPPQKKESDLYMKYRSYAEHCSPVLASVVWTDEKNNTELFLYDIHCLQIIGQSRFLGPDSSVLTLV